MAGRFFTTEPPGKPIGGGVKLKQTNKQKKNAQYESCELSFIWGKMGTVTQEIAPKIALRNCNMRERGRAQLLKE